MNWTQELIDSTLWIVKAFILTTVFFSFTLFLITRFTQWGKQFWLLAVDYFSPKNSVIPLILFSIIIFLQLFSVRLNVIYSNWYNALYSSLQDFDQVVFWQQMILFIVIAGLSVVNALISYYLSKQLTIRWRAFLNTLFLKRWFNNQAYYKAQYQYNQLENPDQRITQDIEAYINSTLGFAKGIISSTVTLVAFLSILWNLSGPVAILGVEIPHMMVFLTFLYVLITTVIAFKLGRPLVHLNFMSEKLNADYRYSLIRVKEYAENIAFYMGEKAEKNILYSQFNSVIKNMWEVVHRTLKFSGFNLIVSQISVVFPMLIQINRYFSHQIKLGDLMQTLQTFDHVHSALSYFRNVYDDFTAYRATLIRLTGFMQIVDESIKLHNIECKINPDKVILENLTIRNSEGKILIEQLNLNLQEGDSILIKGASGIGKTTLLRTIAGLWGYAEGDIYCPDKHNCLFLSQKTYLPQGNLLQALYYPTTLPSPENQSEEKTFEKATALLETVQLGHLSDRLKQKEDWSRILSLGEQQRLAFARLLLQQPKVAFLDEATSSMDEGLEYAMYHMIKQHLPNMILISVGHRSTLAIHHQKQLQIIDDGKWKLEN